MAQFKGSSAWSQNATRLWVGCAGQTGRLELALDGGYQELTGTFGVHAAFDGQATMSVMVLVDNQPAASLALDSTAPSSRQLAIDVSGAETVTVEARAEGDCSGVRDDIAFLGDGAVSFDS